MAATAKMAGRRTNLALLWVSILALVTGVAAFTVGSPSGGWVIVAHGVIALAIVVLIPWKSMIAARGLTRRRPGRVLSIALAAVTALALASGLLLVVGGVDRLGPFTTMQVHVSAGVLAISLTLVHTLQRPVPHRGSDFSRRNLLRAAGVLAAGAGVWLAVEGVLDVTGRRGGQRRFTGSHEIVDPGAIPYTQWLNDTVQHLDEDHRVAVAGTAHSVAGIGAGGDVVPATLDCTGGWFTTQDWSGIRLDRLLEEAEGTSIVVRSTTGYWRRFPREQASRLWLATHVAGEPLADGNGGPVRLVAPGRRGYWWVKWVESVEVDDRPAWWQPPLPTA